MEYLHHAVCRTVSALSNLRTEIDTCDAQVRHPVLHNLDIQLVGLRTLENELRAGAPSRRVWSLGQASMPVLPVILKSVAQQTHGLQRAAIDECCESVAALGAALVRYAEDR